MRTLIKNGTIVTATDLYRGDLLIDGDTISTIGTSLSIPADRVMLPFEEIHVGSMKSEGLPC